MATVGQPIIRVRQISPGRPATVPLPAIPCRATCVHAAGPQRGRRPRDGLPPPRTSTPACRGAAPGRPPAATASALAPDWSLPPGRFRILCEAPALIVPVSHSTGGSRRFLCRPTLAERADHRSHRLPPAATPASPGSGDAPGRTSYAWLGRALPHRARASCAVRAPGPQVRLHSRGQSGCGPAPAIALSRQAGHGVPGPHSSSTTPETGSRLPEFGWGRQLETSAFAQVSTTEPRAAARTLPLDVQPP